MWLIKCLCKSHKDILVGLHITRQAKEGNWIDSKTLLQYLGDGTLKKNYESQQKNFIDAGDVDKKVPIEDYVLFDVMEEAGK